MAARYTNITLDEFDSFMDEMKFERTVVTGGEFVYERHFKRVKAKIRVYSSITVNGRARKRGGDAIRVVAFYLNEERWIPTGKNKRVHRVERWRANLQDRIDEVRLDIHPDPCPLCNSPMLLREGKFGHFYSCSTWAKTKCKGRTTA